MIPEAKLIIFKILNRYGAGDIEYMTSAIYSAIDKYNVDIINISVGYSEYDENLHNAVKYAYKKNIPIYAAAGNNNLIEYPANHKEVISVGSLDAEGNISKFSSNNCDTYQIGENITSTYLNHSYEVMTGSSMACAIATSKKVKEMIK